MGPQKKRVRYLASLLSLAFLVIAYIAFVADIFFIAGSSRQCSSVHHKKSGIEKATVEVVGVQVSAQETSAPNFFVLFNMEVRVRYVMSAQASVHLERHPSTRAQEEDARAEQDLLSRQRYQFSRS